MENKKFTLEDLLWKLCTEEGKAYAVLVAREFGLDVRQEYIDMAFKTFDKNGDAYHALRLAKEIGNNELIEKYEKEWADWEPGVIGGGGYLRRVREKAESILKLADTEFNNGNNEEAKILYNRAFSDLLSIHLYNDIYEKGLEIEKASGYKILFNLSNIYISGLCHYERNYSFERAKRLAQSLGDNELARVYYFLEIQQRLT